MIFTALKPSMIAKTPQKLCGLPLMDTLMEALSLSTTIGFSTALVLVKTITTSSTRPSSSGLMALTLLDESTESQKLAKTSQF